VSGRRVHERFEYELAVTIVHGEEEIHAVSKNLSLGGMYVVTDVDLPYGTDVTVRFRLPALKEETNCAATVRWKKDDGVGLQFGSLRALEVWALNQLYKQVTRG
jgi:c-di-GMP-binding flagellar brake protein YcgR